MKIAALVPYWVDYHPDNKSHKNLKKLGGRYLINYSLKLLENTENISIPYVYASNEDILAYTDSTIEFEYLQRPKRLDDDNIAIEDIIDCFLDEIDADVIVLLPPNSPFLQLATITECVEKVISGDYDSAFTAIAYKKLCWYQGSPLNYSLTEPTPKPQDIPPVIFEQSSLYVFSKASYIKNRKRIGDTPFIKYVDHFEGHEISIDEDFKIAELIVNSGMYTEL
jgi:CMP-N-acetylneuraminic acid synthetase